MTDGKELLRLARAQSVGLSASGALNFVENEILPRDRRIAELEAENKRLREAIEKAPHSHDCKANREGVKNCSYWCWKLSALEHSQFANSE